MTRRFWVCSSFYKTYTHTHTHNTTHVGVAQQTQTYCNQAERIRTPSCDQPKTLRILNNGTGNECTDWLGAMRSFRNANFFCLSFFPFCYLKTDSFDRQENSAGVVEHPSTCTAKLMMHSWHVSSRSDMKHCECGNHSAAHRPASITPSLLSSLAHPPKPVLLAHCTGSKTKRRVKTPLNN